MKAYRLCQEIISILVLAVLLVGFIPVQSVHATPSVWDFTGSMAAFRTNHTATLLNNGKVLVTGGNNLFSAELYDPVSGTWSNTGSMKYGRMYHTATLLTNGKVLVVGGSNAGGYLFNAEIYDPATGLWTNTGSLHTGRYSHTATLLSNGQVLVVGGYHGSAVLASAELYDPTTGLWTFTGSLNTGRDLHTATLLPSGKVLVAGGQINSGPLGYLSNAELYDPMTGTWTYTANSMAAHRKYHTATLLPNDKVLVVGGLGYISGSATYLASAELYDPDSDTWTGAGSLTTSRYYHTTTLLAKGQVLVVGGIGIAGTALGSAEIYDPAVPTVWTLLPSPLNNPRYNHTAVQLSSGPYNGQVLAAGGYGSTSLQTAELYDPTFPTEAPGVPVLVSPSGSTNTQPSYIWHYSIGATSYHLTVDSIPSSGHVIDNVVVNPSFCSGGLCTYHPSGALPVGDYQFKVNASNAFGSSTDSDWMTFSALSDLIISGNAGVDGVTLTYFDVQLKSVTSSGGGNYSFPISFNWSGTITPTFLGYYTFTPPSSSYSNLVENKTNQDFVATPVFHTITGNAGVGGATLNFTGGTPVTAESDGTYTITVPWDWSGTVTPSMIGYTFSPVNRPYLNVKTDQTGQIYAATLTTYLLSVSKTGAAASSGIVTSSPASIDCGSTCSSSFLSGTYVTLTASSPAGTKFNGWSGVCSGTDTCSVNMDVAKSVTANFTTGTSYTLTVNTIGGGTVTSSPTGINCGTTCSSAYINNTIVTLTASPSAGSIFSGWSGGGCSGTDICTVTVTGAVSVSANFTLGDSYTLSVSKTGAGSGMVTSSPAGLVCGPACSSAFPNGTSVTLTASPSAGSIFTGWSGGGCSGTDLCTVTVDAAKSVTANFDTGTSHNISVSKTGTGNGTVTSSPAGIACGPACSSAFPDDSSVTLTASASTGSTFTGWSGSGCSGTGTCTVIISVTSSVTANFTLDLHRIYLPLVKR